MDQEQLIHQIDAFDWTDVDGSHDSQLPSGPIECVPAEEHVVYYRRLRYALVRQEESQRVYLLTKFILTLSTTNYYALMLHKNSWKKEKHSLDEELFFINELLKENSREYHIWTYKKEIFIKEGLQTIQPYLAKEEQFLLGILMDDTKNYHVWDFKTWLAFYSHRELESFKQTTEMLFTPVHQEGAINLWTECNSLWSFRFQMLKKIHIQFPELLKQQSARLREFLKQHAYNECAWNYLQGLCFDLPIGEKEVQQSISLGWKIGEQNNRFALNLLLQLYPENQSRPILQKLQKIDPTRESYYNYWKKLIKQ